MTSSSNSLAVFERHLENHVKSCFSRHFRDEEKDCLVISPNYYTQSLLSDILRRIGLSVYGMEITTDRYTIICELEDDLSIPNISNGLLRYCEFHFDNEGSYEIEITEDTLEDDWHLSIRSCHYNIFPAPGDDIEAIALTLNNALTMKLLKSP